MQKFYSKLNYDFWLEGAPSELKEWFQKEIVWIKENIKPGSRVLDVGCGFGRHIEILAPLCEEIVGIDSSRYMINRAKNKLSGLKNIKLFIQDAANLKFEDSCFDYVICMTNTFGNLADKKVKALKEMKRVCKEGGKIIVSVYSEKSFETRRKSYENSRATIKIEDNMIHVDDVPCEQFTKPQLEELFDSVGLQVEIIELTPIAYLCVAEKA